METPVLFIIFNKLDSTQEVLGRIAVARPNKLYVASDGPRKHVSGEKELVESIRKLVVDAVTWSCELKICFREENLGCSRGPNAAIDWLFENEEAGIILEDDTVPESSFFPYCEELLEKYKDDDRVGMISGNNHLSECSGTSSYFFSKFKWTWGWATWRRAWVNQDIDMDWLKADAAESIINNMGYTQISRSRWGNNIEKIKSGRVAAWDFQWFLSLSSQNQLSIVPRVNLVANVGFGLEGATHCKGAAPDKYIRTLPLQFPLEHPAYILPDIAHDHVYERVMVRLPSGFQRRVLNPVKALIKRLLRK
jgi:hypothetical protein